MKINKPKIKYTEDVESVDIVEFNNIHVMDKENVIIAVSKKFVRDILGTT